MLFKFHCTTAKRDHQVAASNVVNLRWYVVSPRWHDINSWKQVNHTQIKPKCAHFFNLIYCLPPKKTHWKSSPVRTEAEDCSLKNFHKTCITFLFIISKERWNSIEKKILCSNAIMHLCSHFLPHFTDISDDFISLLQSLRGISFPSHHFLWITFNVWRVKCRCERVKWG